MSDKTYWVNKNVKRQMDKCDLVAFDSGASKSWVSTGVMIAIITAVFGIMQYFMGTGWGLYLAIGSGVVGLALFIIGRVYAANVYTEYRFIHDGKEMIFQLVGKKRATFKCEGTILEYTQGKNGGVKEVSTLYRPYATHQALLNVIYDTHVRKGQTVDYISKTKAVVNGKEKNVVYKIRLDNKNVMQSYSANSVSLTAYFLKEGQQKIVVPIALFNAIRKKGITLPGDNLIVLDYGVKENTVQDLKKK